jgi:hypothetical protein
MQTFKKKSNYESHAGHRDAAQDVQNAAAKRPTAAGQTDHCPVTLPDSMQVEEVGNIAKGEGNRAQRRAQKKLVFEMKQQEGQRSAEVTPVPVVAPEVGFEVHRKTSADCGAQVKSETSRGNDVESGGSQRDGAEVRPNLAVADTSAEEAMVVVEDDGMDSLVQGMRRVSVKVPSTISFGRRKRHGHS